MSAPAAAAAPAPRAPETAGAELARLAAVALLSAWPVFVGFASPQDLEAHDQGRQAMYVVGALDGDWLVPHDRDAVASKPPLYTWLAALGAAIFGLDETTVRFPSALATLVLGLATYALGRRLVGPTAAVIGVALLATLQHMTKLGVLVRTDMLLSAWIALAFVALAYGRSLAFWVCVGLATLTKGPPGVAIPLAALAVHFGARRDLEGLRALRPVRGLAIVGGMVLLWLAPAFVLHGDAMREMFQLHLVDQLTNTGLHEGAKSQPFWYLVAYYGVKLLPFSLLLPLAFRPHGRPADPAFLLVAWIAGGLFVFLFPPNKRPDHLLPMYAPAALLAGSVVAPWLRGAAAPALARALDGGARVWALGAGAFAALAVPIAWTGLLHTTVSPPVWAGAAGLLALVPARAALRAGVAPRSRLGAALAAQALLGLVWAQVLSAPASEGTAPDVRRFVAEAVRRAGSTSDLVLCQVRSWSAPFLLQRNDAPVPIEELARIAAGPTPRWVVLPAAVREAWAAHPESFGGRAAPGIVVASAEGRAPERGDLVLVRVGGEATPAPAAAAGVEGGAGSGPAPDAGGEAPL